MQRLIFDRDLPLPADRVFDYLSEHENLEEMFGAKVTRVRDGVDGTRNGVGSVRSLKVGPLAPFEETVTEVIPNELIRYRITKGSPLRNHSGEMRLITIPTGCHLHYEIRFGAVVPGLAAIIAAGLKRNVESGIDRIATSA